MPDRALKNTSAKPDAALSPAWLAAGTVMFSVAVATPLLVLNFLPDINKMHAAKLADADAKAIETPLAVQADERPDYPEIALAANDEASGEDKMGSLATLIDKQGIESPPTTAPAVRRMVLDAVSVDLESSRSVTALDHLRVPLQNCDLPKHSDAVWLIDEGPKIRDALRSLPSDLSLPTSTHLAGPSARDRATVHEGIRVEYCADFTRISAVEILPLDPVHDPGSMLALATLELRNTADAELSRTTVHTGDIDATPTTSREVSGQSRLIGPQPSGSVKQPAQVGQPSTGSVDATVVEHGPALEDAPTVLANHGDSATGRADHSIDTDPARVAGADPSTPQRTEISAPIAPLVPAPAELLAINGDAFSVATDISPPALKQDGYEAPLLALGSPLKNQPTGPITPTKASLPFDVAAIEDDLKLNRKARWRAQLRLALLGHDPKGIDGIFGEGTRKAISRLQEAEALPATGYLDAFTLAVLKEKSQRRYTNWVARRARAQAERRASQQVLISAAPQQVRGLPAARRATRCARDSKGIIISNQSFGCDLNVLREGLGSLFGSSG